MPAAPAGTVTQTWRDKRGNLAIQIIYHFNPTTGTFDTNPAIEFQNLTGRNQKIDVFLPGEQNARSVNMPTGTGSVTRAQVTSFTDGAVTSFYQGGWTLDPVNF